MDRKRVVGLIKLFDIFLPIKALLNSCKKSVIGSYFKLISLDNPILEFFSQQIVSLLKFIVNYIWFILTLVEILLSRIYSLENLFFD